MPSIDIVDKTDDKDHHRSLALQVVGKALVIDNKLLISRILRRYGPALKEKTLLGRGVRVAHFHIDQAKMHLPVTRESARYPQRRHGRVWGWLLALCLYWLGGVATPAYATGGPLLFKKGVEALQKGQYYQATQLLQGALKTLSHWGLVHLELARAMQFNGDPAEDITRHLHKAIASLPQNPRAQLLAGLFYEGRGDTHKALAHYRQALRLGHFAPTACLRSSAILIAQKQGAQAIACLTPLQNKRPQPANIHVLLARAHQQAGQWVKAGEQWSKAHAKQPTSLTLLRKVFTFYKQHTPQQPRPIKAQWQRTLSQLQRKLRKLLPRRRYRNLRPLLPSKH